jgi:glycosyltransferase involved in cell wall biosynthesis
MLLHLLQAHKGSELTYTLMFMEDGPLVQKAAALGYDVKVIHPGKLRQIGRYVSTVRSLYGWIKEENISVVLSWMSKAHLYAGPAAWLGRVPAVWYQHGMPHNNLMESLIAAIPARAVMCPSQWIKEAENRLSPKLHTVVVHPSVDLERFTPAAVPPVHEVRSRLGLPADRLIVGIVARLQRWKGIHTFLDAAALVLKEQPDVEFVIVGGSHYSETDYPGELERQAEQAGIGSRVRFAGHQPDTASWIQAFDIAVHCSDKEPFGMVVIESMAMGKPVIASKAGGPLEIITHGVDGLLVVPGNANQLASAIKLLVDHERCRARLSRAGLERAKVFSKERLAAETARLLVSMTIKESRELQHDYTAPSYSRK